MTKEDTGVRIAMFTVDSFRCSHLLQPLEVLPQEGHGPVRPRGAQLHDAVFQQLLDVVLLHIQLALPKALLLLAAGAAGCHGNLLIRSGPQEDSMSDKQPF